MLLHSKDYLKNKCAHIDKHYQPDELYDIIEECSPGPYLELFARFRRQGWHQWGNEDVEVNSFHGIAKRKAHIDPQLRLLECPRGYGT